MGRMYFSNKKLISEIPETVLKTLYDLRFYEDLEIPYNEYIKRYKLITIGNVVYYAHECPEWRLLELLSSYATSSRKTTLPDAVINNGLYVTKNRFGHNSFL